jgi:hypothetical protein
MRVRLTRNYTAPPEWGQYAYAMGLIVTGQLAMWALQDGAGVMIEPELERKVEAPPEIKAEVDKPRRGRPPKKEAA